MPKSTQNCRLSCCSRLLGDFRRKLIVERHFLQRKFVLAGGIIFLDAEGALHDAAQFFQFGRGPGRGFAIGAFAFKTLGHENGAGNALDTPRRLSSLLVILLIS